MKHREVYIKAWFGDWKKVTLPQAVKFFKDLKSGMCRSDAIKNSFDKHFKGITYKEIIKELGD